MRLVEAVLLMVLLAQWTRPADSKNNSEERKQQQQQSQFDKPRPKAMKKVANSTVREKVTAFYRRNSPDKLETIDGILFRYLGREEQLLADLEAKYSGEGHAAAATPSPGPPLLRAPGCVVKKRDTPNTLAMELLNGTVATIDFRRCKRVQLCADGGFAGGWRCDETPDCTDGSDEHGCTKEDYELDWTTVSNKGGDGHGASLWPSSLVLNAWLEAHPEVVRGKSVLELGSGIGTVSLSALKLGAASVVATDGALQSVENANHNVRSNHAPVASTYRMQQREQPQLFRSTALSWGDVDQIATVRSLSPNGEGFDVIIGADLLYHSETAQALIETYKAFCKHTLKTPRSDARLEAQWAGNEATAGGEGTELIVLSEHRTGSENVTEVFGQLLRDDGGELQAYWHTD